MFPRKTNFVIDFKKMCDRNYNVHIYFICVTQQLEKLKFKFNLSTTFSRNLFKKIPFETKVKEIKLIYYHNPGLNLVDFSLPKISKSEKESISLILNKNVFTRLLFYGKSAHEIVYVR